VDVKVGITDNGREVTVAMEATPEEIEKQVSAALQSDKTLTLIDEKGRRVMVPSAKIAYVEIGPADSRRVGFGS
jgi:hypothetical protein